MARDTPLGFPAHTLPYRCGGFTTLSTVSSPEQCSGFFLFRNGNKVDIHENRKIILNGP